MDLNEKEQMFLEANKAQVNEIFAEREKNLISKKAFNDGLEQIKSQYKGSEETLKQITDQLEANKSALEAQGMTLKEIQNVASKNDDGDIEKQLFQFKDNLLSLSKKDIQKQQIVLKTEYARTSVTSNPMGMFADSIGRTGTRKLALYDLFPKIPLAPESNGVYRYIDQSTATRNAAAVAESGAYPESAYAATGYSLPVEKIGDSIPITLEALRHTAQLAAEVELFIQTNVNVAVETNLATGSGTTPALKGIYTSSTA